MGLIHKIIILSCLKFRGLTKNRKPLALEKCFSNLLNSAVEEIPKFTKHRTNLPDYRITRLKHQMKINRISPYLLSAPQDQNYKQVLAPSREDFILLKRIQFRGTGGFFLEFYRGHPMAKRAVRLVSNLFHICTGSKNKNSIISFFFNFLDLRLGHILQLLRS